MNNYRILTDCIIITYTGDGIITRIFKILRSIEEQVPFSPEIAHLIEFVMEQFIKRAFRYR